MFIVDDDPDIRESTQTVLELYGYRVATAKGGAEALEQLKRGEQPCIILLDLMMPGMNGIQLREELARDPVLAAIPIVIVSARDDVAGIATSLGIEWLAKPIDLSVLLDKVERHGCTTADTN